MTVNDIVFISLLTVVAIAWVCVFKQYVQKVVEQKTRQAVKLYGPAPTTIEGTFVYHFTVLICEL